MSCYCDYDMPSFFKQKFVKAKKQHTCFECKKKINIGDEYEYVSGKWDGDFNDFHTCNKCCDLRDSLAIGGCFRYGELSDEYMEYLTGWMSKQEAIIQFNKVMK